MDLSSSPSSIKWLLSTLATLLVASFVLSCGSEPAPTTKEAADPTAVALERFDDNKFGMFIHWGLYAFPRGSGRGNTCAASANGS